jgi:hypothetical protein
VSDYFLVLDKEGDVGHERIEQQGREVELQLGLCDFDRVF